MTDAAAAGPREVGGSLTAVAERLAAHVRECLAACARGTATDLLRRLAVNPPRLDAHDIAALAAHGGPIELLAASPRVEVAILAAWRADATTARTAAVPEGIHVLCGRAFMARRVDGASAFELVGEGESAIHPPAEPSHCAAARDGVDTVVLHVSDGVGPHSEEVVRWGFDPDAATDYYWGYEERYAAVYDAGAELWESAEPNGSLVTFTERHPHLGRRVLDLGCGEGRDSLFLAHRGFEVTGVDVSRTALDRARGRAAAEGVRLTFFERDVIYLRNLGEQPFHWAINMGCLHMLDDDAARAAHLARVKELLEPSGLFLVSHCTRDWGRGFYSVPHYEELGRLLPGMHTQRRIRIGDAEGNIELAELPYRESSAGELCGELSAAGFQIVEQSAEDTYAFGNAAVIVARRPAARET